MHERSRQSRTRPIAIMAVLTLLASLLSVILVSPVSAADDPSCGNIIVIGSRGSGQETNTIGTEVQNFSTRLATEVLTGGSAATVNNVVLPYAAPAVLPDPVTVAAIVANQSGGFGVYAAAFLSPLQASINDGVTMLKGLIQTTSVRCPSSQIVLAGYSQGAMVIHQLYQREGAVTAKVFASVLIADGDRVSNQGTGAQTADFGTARTDAVGVRTFASLGGYLPAFPANFSLIDGRIVDVCDKGDIVCDFNHTANILTGIGIHTTNYKTNSKGVNNAAIKVAAWYRKSFGTFKVTDVANNGVIQTLTSVTPCPPPPASRFVEIIPSASLTNPNNVPQYQAINADGSWSTHVWMIFQPPQVNYNARTATATVTPQAYTSTFNVRCVVAHGPSSPTVMPYSLKTVKASKGWKYQIKINSRTATSISYTISPVDRCPAQSQTAWIFSDVRPDQTPNGVAAVQNPPPLITNGNWAQVTVTRDITYWASPVVYLSAWVSCGDTDVNHGDTVRFGAYGWLSGWQVP